MSLAELEAKYGNEDYEETFEGPEVELSEDEIDEPLVPTEEFETSLRDAEDVDRATVAVESYLQVLTQRERQGLVLTEDVAKIIRVGLEAIDPNFFSNTVISVENVLEGELVDDDDVETGYGAKESNHENSKFRDLATEKTKSGLLDRLKKLMEAAFEALKRLFQASLNLYHNVVTNVDKMVAKIDDVAKRSTVLEGGHKFKMRGLGRLSIDGKFVGDDPKQYENLAKTASVVLHEVSAISYRNTIAGYKDVIEILKDRSKLLEFINPLNKDEEGVSSRIWSVKGNLLNTQEGILKSLASKLKPVSNLDDVPTSIKTSFSIPDNRATPKNSLSAPMKTETLMGDKAFYMALPGSEFDLTNAVLKMDIFTVPNAKTNLGVSEETLTTIKASDAIAILGMIKGLVNSISNHKTEFAKVNKEVQSIISSGSRAQNTIYEVYRSNPSSVDNNRAVDITQLVKLYNRTLRNITSANWNFIGYIFATSKAAVAMVDQMVNVEEITPK